MLFQKSRKRRYYNSRNFLIQNHFIISAPKFKAKSKKILIYHNVSPNFTSSLWIYVIFIPVSNRQLDISNSLSILYLDTEEWQKTGYSTTLLIWKITFDNCNTFLNYISLYLESIIVPHNNCLLLGHDDFIQK